VLILSIVPRGRRAACGHIPIDCQRPFDPDEIKAMAAAYEAALIDLQLIDRNEPLRELIAKAIVTVTATGERDPENIKERALNALGVRRTAT
jgi:hypothetical protein